MDEDEFRYKVLPNRIRHGNYSPLQLQGFEVGEDTFLISPRGDLMLLDRDMGLLLPERNRFLLGIQQEPDANAEHALQRKDFVD